MLIGKNLSLRPATVEDAQLLADWSSDPDFLGEFFNIWPVIRQRMEQRLVERQKQDLVESGQFLICNLDMTKKMGTIGYFTTYALGNLISVQLWETFRALNPNIDDLIRKGDFSTLLTWLREKIHQHGRKYEPRELVQRITGSAIDPAPYLRYLKTKYGEIYGI